MTAESPSDAVAHLFVSDFEFDEADRDRLIAALGAGHAVLVRGAAALHQALAAHPEAEVLCSFRPPADALELAPGLRWIALPSAGADSALRAGLVRPGGPIVTTANGVHAVPMGEHVFGVLLMWARNWPMLLAAQHERSWPDHPRWRALRGVELDGATLGIVGLGAIGRQIAHLGRAFGMRVLGVRRSAQAGQSDPDVDALFPPEQLREMLAQADYVVIAAPSTPETQHLIGAAELAAMKPTAFLVNIARGALVDEAALIRALGEGRIGGAGLDVFEREPLPLDSPLWTMANVIISPHLAGSSPSYSRRFTDLLLDNLARYRAGEPLRNVVQPERGY
jgi:phosphoglycerate dehydrogenase-like enzyme